MGRRDYITVQISSENTLVQIHKPEMQGDKVLASAHSRYLLGKGWKGSRKNIPAAYLTGYLAGKKALVKGVNAAVLYSEDQFPEVIRVLVEVEGPAVV